MIYPHIGERVRIVRLNTRTEEVFEWSGTVVKPHETKAGLPGIVIQRDDIPEGPTWFATGLVGELYTRVERIEE